MSFGIPFALVASLWAIPAYSVPFRTDFPLSSYTMEVTREPASPRNVGGFEVRLLPETLRWDFLPDSFVSVPWVKLEVKPRYAGTRPLLKQTQTLETSDGKTYFADIPLTGTDVETKIRLMDENRNFEDWLVALRAQPAETRIFVDRSCSGSFEELFEIHRTLSASFVFVGCDTHADPKRLKLQFRWDPVETISHEFKDITRDGDLFTVGADYNSLATSEFVGKSGEDTATLALTPAGIFPFEIEAGVALLNARFTQSNFPSVFNQTAAAVFTKIAWRRPGHRFNGLVRGLLTLIPFSETLRPTRSQPESMKTNYVSAEARYQVWESHGWSIAPVLGGWFFFTTVPSQNFGIARIIDPILGIVLERDFRNRDRASLAYRVVPLQAESGLGSIFGDRAYIEAEIAYSRALGRTSRIGGHFLVSGIDYNPPAPNARTQGHYFIGGLSFSFQ